MRKPDTCRRYVLTIAVAIFLMVKLHAQTDAYRFNTIDSRRGLSNNQVNFIFKDKRGFVWFATASGLNRFDGYNFKTFRHKNGDSTSINDDYVSHIIQGPDNKLLALTPYGWNVFDPHTEKFSNNLTRFIGSRSSENGSFTNVIEDANGSFWFVFPGKGLLRYYSGSATIDFYNARDRRLPLHSNAVNAIGKDGKGFLWIVYGDGFVEKLNSRSNEIIYRTGLLQAFTPTPTLSYRLFVDNENHLWIFPKGEARGVFFLNPDKNEITALQQGAVKGAINNNIVNAVTQDEKGLIWLATDHGGINVVNKADFSVKYLVSNETEPGSISQNSVTTLSRDYSGIIWAGTYKKGVNQFHISNLQFPLFQHKASDPRSLVYNDVNKFLEDKHGNLWIGTNGGGLLYFDRKKGNFTRFRHSESDPASLSNDIIVSLCLDHNNTLWIGTYFGGLNSFDGKSFTHYKHSSSNPSSLSDDRVWEIFEDSQHRLWIGTLREGVDLLIPSENKFIHYKPGGTNSTLQSGYVSSIVEDRLGNIWFATAGGLDVLEKQSGSFRHFAHQEGNSQTLSHNHTVELVEDQNGFMWIATRDGLDVFNPQTQRFQTFRMEDGLPDNSILTVVQDSSHQLWVTTPNGIANITTKRTADGTIQLRCKSFDEADGLQGKQFNENAAYVMRTGEIVVGGPNGFNLIAPGANSAHHAEPFLVLTDLQIFNNSVKIGQPYNGKTILPQSISEMQTITLDYNQNVFTIEFAALEYLNADKMRYQYKLEGFSNEWLTTDAKNRKATFTNLNPGYYTLRIKAGNNYNHWYTKNLSLAIQIRPPFWLTPIAYVLYVLLFLALLFAARSFILKRARARFEVEQERQRAQRLHELDMMKIKFFTNISHEFRTPLSLILSPAEKLLKSNTNGSEKLHFQLIHRNARRLLNLVNQLMDFRKLEEQELKLNPAAGDLVAFTREVCASFADLAEQKNISFSVDIPEQYVFSNFDHDKLERILFNLLSNAFKFTPASGSVKVSGGVANTPGSPMFQITVRDSGIGIPKDKQEQIFERFFQAETPGSVVNQGSGIGLAITKEFVRMHGGTLEVESLPDVGTAFTVTIPMSPLVTDSYPRPETPAMQPQSENTPTQVNEKSGFQKKILLVEDNEDFRFYIKDNLRSQYRIIEAENGKLGWQRALAEHPDLIVCDVSMPEMNGIELCQKLKSDNRTSFIPVLLLTALTGEDQQIAGLQTGANDYMTKPFNVEILQSKIRNLLTQQENFRKTYQRQVSAVPVELEKEESGDQKFLRQLLAVLETNIANPEFSVETLSEQVFISRVTLYKRLFDLTGKTPLEFIRSFRLQRAAQLLRNKELSIAEVAYAVGFNNPKYFSKYFKEEFGLTPSAYQIDFENSKNT